MHDLDHPSGRSDGRELHVMRHAPCPLPSFWYRNRIVIKIRFYEYPSQSSLLVESHGNQLKHRVLTWELGLGSWDTRCFADRPEEVFRITKQVFRSNATKS